MFVLLNSIKPSRYIKQTLLLISFLPVYSTHFRSAIFPSRHKPSIPELITLFAPHLPVAIISSEVALKANIRKAKPSAAQVKLC